MACPSSFLEKELKTFFGYTHFRENQKEAIETILSSKDLFLSMATGEGKSLCYQLPAMLMEGVGVVISPLISLMKDQVDNAVAKGIPACYLNSTLSAKEKQLIYRNIYEGTIKLIYLSPELILEENFIDFFKKMTKNKIAFFAIDEAHCITQWGNSFREEYSKLYKLKNYFPHVPIAAFTATATLQQQDEIIKTLRLTKPVVIRSNFDRKDLSYKVISRKKKIAQIDSILQLHKNQYGIIYTQKKEEAQNLASKLTALGYLCAPYHSDLPISQREKNQKLFLQNKIQIICATIGFGMGIDKKDIRFIIHTFMPNCLEDYSQQTGRASRDKQGAICYLLYSPKDFQIWKMIIKNDKSYNGEENYLQLQQVAYEKLMAMQSFCNATSCRRKILLSYFDQEQLTTNCNACDICLGLTPLFEGLNEAKAFVSIIEESGQRFGKNYIIDLLCGNINNITIKKYAHQQLRYFGYGKNHSKSFWLFIHEKLLQEHYITCIPNNGYPILKITQKGYSLLQEKSNANSTKYLFPLPNYLQEKQKEEKSKRINKQKEIGVNENLLKELLFLRSKIATANECEPIFIASQKAIVQMAKYLPVTKKELYEIEGLPSSTIENFSTHFIALISTYKKSRYNKSPW